MAAKKPVAKVVEVKHSRGLEFNCSKLLKKLRFSMTKVQFRAMIMNEKTYQANKKKKSGSTKTED